MQNIRPLESISDLNANIRKAIQAIPKSDQYFIALSGGLDSVALTYFCLPHLKSFTSNVHVIHVHHGLSPRADEWAQFCEQFCRQLGLSFSVAKVTVTNSGKGVEAAARKARYEIFEQHLQHGGLLLLGHHLNDQAETVLMRTFKGLGPEALRGMPKKRELADGSLFRPFLGVPRADIEEAVKFSDLMWIEDESNLDVQFDRNYIRRDVLPLLSKRQPSILTSLEHTAKKAQESFDFIQEWCEQNKPLFLSEKYKNYQAINLSGLKSYSAIQQKFILRFWFDYLCVPHPSQGSFDRVFEEVLYSKSDSKAEVCWGGYILKAFDDALFCLPRFLVEAKPLHSFERVAFSVNELRGEQAIELPTGKLIVKQVSVEDFNFHLKTTPLLKGPLEYELVCRVSLSREHEKLSIGFRKGGEIIHMQKLHSTKLKKLYQAERVLPWVRDKFPLIYSGEELICTLAGFTSKSHQIEQGLDSTLQDQEMLIYFRFSLG